MLDRAAESRSLILSSSSSLPRRGGGDLNALSSDVPAAGITPRASPRSPHHRVRAADDSRLARVGLSQLGAGFRQVVLAAPRALPVEAALDDPHTVERPQPRREDIARATDLFQELGESSAAVGDLAYYEQRIPIADKSKSVVTGEMRAPFDSSITQT